MVQNYKQLKIWKRSFQLAIEIYKLTNKFPKSEKYNLTAQLRRADTSISSNIAEGASKHTSVDFQRYLYQAYGSLKEVESQLLLSKELMEVHMELEMELSDLEDNTKAFINDKVTQSEVEVKKQFGEMYDKVDSLYKDLGEVSTLLDKAKETFFGKAVFKDK